MLFARLQFRCTVYDYGLGLGFFAHVLSWHGVWGLAHIRSSCHFVPPYYVPRPLPVPLCKRVGLQTLHSGPQWSAPTAHATSLPHTISAYPAHIAPHTLTLLRMVSQDLRWLLSRSAYRLYFSSVSEAQAASSSVCHLWNWCVLCSTASSKVPR